MDDPKLLLRDKSHLTDAEGTDGLTGLVQSICRAISSCGV
jgi:hypothetical protein